MRVHIKHSRWNEIEWRSCGFWSWRRPHISLDTSPNPRLPIPKSLLIHRFDLPHPTFSLDRGLINTEEPKQVRTHNLRCRPFVLASTILTSIISPVPPANSHYLTFSLSSPPPPAALAFSFCLSCSPSSLPWRNAVAMSLSLSVAELAPPLCSSGSNSSSSGGVLKPEICTSSRTVGQPAVSKFICTPRFARHWRSSPFFTKRREIEREKEDGMKGCCWVRVSGGETSKRAGKEGERKRGRETDERR